MPVSEVQMINFVSENQSMSLLRRFRQWIAAAKEKEPGSAYDLWSDAYDNQPDNLMLDLDETLFGSLLERMRLQGKHLADIGCGTGRHWQKILDQSPASLTGFDVSEGMLKKLQVKFPGARTLLVTDEKLPAATGAFDTLVSTLAIAHVEDIAGAFAEWNRVLKPGGDILLTDYHPMALARGGKRTFTHRGRTLAVKNYIHPLEKIRLLAGQLEWEEIRFIQREIDDSVKDWYERLGALSLFEQFRQVPIIYGFHFRKKNGAS